MEMAAFSYRENSQPLQYQYTQVEAMLEGPLSTRGWAFQEHQLSTRIIHFSKSRLIWECRGCMASEEFPIQTYRRLLRTGTGRNRIEDWVDTCRLFDNRIDESRHTFGSNAEGALQNVSENSIIRFWLIGSLVRMMTWGTERIQVSRVSELAQSCRTIFWSTSYF